MSQAETPACLTNAFDGYENLRAKMRYLRKEIDWRAYKALYAEDWISGAFDRASDYVSMLREWERKRRPMTGEMNIVMLLAHRLEKRRPDTANDFFYSAGIELMELDEKIKY